eukprot:TRINITY_DN792_c2_g1_i4.p1 TRINITY_DN792_c2_g1~~TRINITY_DN792_c2_g1_i4.p1  ORF type:complete len:245 (+),score=32.03 TRINITY_DN792_c2_g1_i4:395-1129(+)
MIWRHLSLLENRALIENDFSKALDRGNFREEGSPVAANGEAWTETEAPSFFSGSGWSSARNETDSVLFFLSICSRKTDFFALSLSLSVSSCNSSDLLTPAIQTEKPHFFYVTGQQTDVDEIGISSPQQNLDPLLHLATGFFDGDGPGSSTFSDEISIRTALCKDRTQTELESYSNQKRMAESGVLSVSLRHYKPDRKPLSPFFLQTQLDFRPPTPNPIAAPITCSTTPNPRKNPRLEEIGGQSH